MKFFEPHPSIKKFIDTSREYFMGAYETLSREACEWYGLSKLGPGSKILEFGGGEGWISVHLSKMTRATFIYNDMNPEVCELAQKNFKEAGIDKRVKILNEKVEKLDLPNDSIDFIISRGTIQFTEYKTTLSNVVRWLKPGGTAMIGCGFGLNISDDCREKMNGFFKKKEKEGVNTASDKFDEFIVEGYKHLIDKHFDDELEYVKAANLHGLFFMIKKSEKIK